VAGFHFTKRP